MRKARLVVTLLNVVPPRPLTLVVVNILYVVKDEGAKLPPASTFTVPPVNVALPVTASLSFFPAALALTRKIEPGWKLTLP